MNFTNLNIHHFWPFFIGGLFLQIMNFQQILLLFHMAYCEAYKATPYSWADAPELLVFGALAAANDYWQIISRNFGAKRLFMMSKIAISLILSQIPAFCAIFVSTPGGRFKSTESIISLVRLLLA